MKKLPIILLTIILLTSTVYADPNRPYRQKYIEGYLMEISQDKATIEEYDGTFHTINIMVNATLEIDGIPVSYSDFRPGMEVYGELQGRTLKVLESYSTENPGYIPAGKKVIAGTIKNLELDSINIKLPSGEEETYTITPGSIITRNGSITSMAKLYEGDKVRLFFDEYNSNTVSRISVEGDSILVKGLYKGTLSFNDNFEDKVVLEKMKRFNNGQWTNYKELVALDYSENLPIHIGGQKINRNNLKHYKGKEVYIAVKDIFGQDKIEKMNVKANRERAYTEKIIDINYYSDSLKLNNKTNFTLSDGTIIVKNDRLVDKYSVNPQSDVFLVSDSSSNPEANILYIYDEDINNSNIGQNYLYFGRLDEIIDYEVLLRDYSVLNRNDWDYYRGTTELTYDEDTQIYNMEDKKLISTKEFQAGNYAVDEDSSYAREKRLRDWYGYLFTDGNNIVAMGIKKDRDDLLRQRITAGTISNLSTDPFVGEVIYLKDSRDWSSRNSSFMPKTQDLRLMLEDAIIVKNDKLISKEELKPGDRLYLVRDDFKCKFILVK